MILDKIVKEQKTRVRRESKRLLDEISAHKAIKIVGAFALKSPIKRHKHICEVKASLQKA